MAVLSLGLALLLAMAVHSDAAYCVCNTGGDAVFQKNIDYACGNGADCSAIQQNGACFNPNTIRDHCNYAVNSYYQRKGPTAINCDFSGSCTVSQTPPSTNTNSGCVYQSGASTGGTTPATPGTPTTGGGMTPPTGGGTTPSTGGGTTPIGGSTTNPGMTPGTPGTFISPPGGAGINPLGPSGNGFDSSASVSLSIGKTFMLVSCSLTLLLLSGGLVSCVPNDLRERVMMHRRKKVLFIAM